MSIFFAHSQIYFSFPLFSPELSTHISACLSAISTWMSSHFLHINRAKTSSLLSCFLLPPILPNSHNLPLLLLATLESPLTILASAPNTSHRSLLPVTTTYTI
ncbi:hypothetical protein FKM82_024444 [Ascaphus truei]